MAVGGAEERLDRAVPRLALGLDRRASRTARPPRAPRAARAAGSSSRRSPAAPRAVHSHTWRARKAGSPRSRSVCSRRAQIHRATVASLVVIDLRSDTVTKPTPGMLAAMAAAEVGDEQEREDPTTNELQRRMAELLGHEAALFLPTATMANQVALRVLSRPGCKVVAEERTHVLIYEWGGPAIHSGPRDAGARRRRGPADARADRRRSTSSAPGSVLVLENTHRSSGGRVWPLDEFRAVVDAARSRGAAVHLDGARLFNASVARRHARRRRGRAAPTPSRSASRRGSAARSAPSLAGSAETIERAWEGKFLFGGALRQSGIAAGRDALRARPQRRAARRRPRARASGSPTGIGDRSRDRRDELRRRFADEPGLSERLARARRRRRRPAAGLAARRHASRHRPTTTSTQAIERIAGGAALSTPETPRGEARPARAQRSSARSGCRASPPPCCATASSSGRPRSAPPTSRPGREATPDTQYRIGSITKTFTAAAIMQLRDAGKLDLEDTLDRHVEGAAHTPTHPPAALARVRPAARDAGRLVADACASRRPTSCSRRSPQAELVLPSGARFHYSNLAFALLGIVVERVSGMPYQDYVRERLFEPVGLTRVSFEPEQPAAKGYLAQPYADGVWDDGRRRDRRVGVGGPAVGDGRRHLPLGRVPRRSRRVGPRGVERRGDADGAGDRRPRALAVRATGSASGCAATATGSSRATAARCPASSRGSSSRPKDKVVVAALTNESEADLGELGVALVGTTVDEWPVAPEAWRVGEPPPDDVVPLLGIWFMEAARVVFRWRDGKLEARFDGMPDWQPSVDLRAGDGRPLAHGLGPGARRGAADRARRGRLGRADGLGRLPGHARARPVARARVAATRTGAPGGR